VLSSIALKRNANLFFAEALQFEADDTPGIGLEDEELAADPLMQIDLTVDIQSSQPPNLTLGSFAG
jgi:hypothetical protein